MKGYKLERKELVQALKGMRGITTVEIRKALKAHKVAFGTVVKAKKLFKDLKITFKPEIWAFHPITGSPAVRVRQQYIEGRDITPVRPQKPTGKAGLQAFLTPSEFDPSYVNRPTHTPDELKGVKQYPVVLEPEEKYSTPNFSAVKSVRMRKAVEAVEFQIGFDSKTNKHVLYSPLAYNKRWDRVSQAVWLRSIGMPPKRIAIQLRTPYDTVRTWMRVLRGQPLIATKWADWATGFTEKADFSHFSRKSTLDAPSLTGEDAAKFMERKGLDRGSP